MRWKIISLALLIFVTGVISGVMGQRLLAVRQQAPEPPARPFPGGPPMPWTSQRMDFLQRLTSELELTSDQAARIDEEIRTSQQRLRELWDPVAPKAHDEMNRSREAIAAVLTPEQKEKMDQMFRRRGGPPRYDRSQPWSRDREGREGFPRGERPWEGEGPNGRFRSPPPVGDSAPSPTPERRPPQAPPVLPQD